MALLVVDTLPSSCSFGFLQAVRFYTGAPVDSCVLHVSSGALGGAPTLWVLMDLHVLYPLLPLFLRGYLGLGFLLARLTGLSFAAPYASPSSGLLQTIHRVLLTHGWLVILWGLRLPVPVLPVTEFSLLPHTLPVLPH